MCMYMYCICAVALELFVSSTLSTFHVYISNSVTFV